MTVGKLHLTWYPLLISMFTMWPGVETKPDQLNLAVSKAPVLFIKLNHGLEIGQDGRDDHVYSPYDV